MGVWCRLFVRFFCCNSNLVYKMARDINMNVFWHDFWSCSISKEDSIRYKWQTKKHLAGIEDGILTLAPRRANESLIRAEWAQLTSKPALRKLWRTERQN